MSSDQIAFAALEATQSTALGTWWLFIATALLFAATVIPVIVGALQIQAVRSENKTERTLNVCMQYDLNPEIIDLSKRVATSVDDFEIDRWSSRRALEALELLNYYDTLAIGVELGSYDEHLVYSHFKKSCSKTATAS